MPPPTISFNCPGCSAPATIDIPGLDMMQGALATVVVVPHQYWTCPKCAITFLPFLAQINSSGMTWAVRRADPPQKKEPSLIIPGHLPVPPFKC